MSEKTVLIVEAYADVRALMKFLVRRYGYTVIEAADGYEAVEQTKEHCLDLILMDISMPLMDGLEATRIIRTLKGYCNTPIIALTAHDKAFYQRAIHAGCDEVIGKPLDFDVLEDLLKRHTSD
jgi:two-component system cell cycle response regulator DivK